MAADPAERFLDLWSLKQDGAALQTASSQLLPVFHEGTPAMLKVALHEEERRGNGLMIHWDGWGAASVLCHDGPAVLLERAEDPERLREMALGDDDGDAEATRILCEAVARLHGRPLPRQLPDLVPLERWFGELTEIPQAAEQPALRAAADIARGLLADQREVTILHGDIHHGNILPFGEKGWLAIDPKGLYGDRAFDYANLFCNPSADLARERFPERLEIVTELARIERQRLLRWIAAWAALGTIWHTDDQKRAEGLGIVQLALERLGG